MATDWVSHVSGPIPNHSIYDAVNDIYPQKKINKLQNENPKLNVQGKGYFGSISNRTVSPKDHMRENVKRMREIQRASRQRQEESKQHRGPIKSTSRPSSCVSTPVDELQQRPLESSTRLKNQSAETVRSFIDDNDRRCRSQSPKLVSKVVNRPDVPPLTVPNRDFIQTRERSGPSLDLYTNPMKAVRPGVTETKVSVPRASTAREVQLIRRDVDFVRANAYAAKSARMRRSPSADSLLINRSIEEEKRKQYRRGETPSYILRRRKQWKEEEEWAIANQPDPDQPDGHRKLSEKERKATLELLKGTEKDMLTELGRLPIRIETLKMRNMKQEIERKLNELEEAIKIFSKPKVFVQIDI